MQTKHIAALVVFSVVLPFSALAQDPPSNNADSGIPPTAKAKIFYTGHMFGYLRDCKYDPLSHDLPSKDCVESRDKSLRLSELAKRFLEEYQDRCGPQSAIGDCILLGMGDNFAPNYKARLDDNGEFKKRNDTNLDYTQDNVARFLYDAKFTALVPGKEDFYFGVYRLWKIGESLNKKSHDSQSQRVPYLADNLVLQPTDEKERDPWSASKKKFTTQFDGIATKFSGKAMPWLVKLSFAFDPPLTPDEANSLKGKLCWSTNNPDDFVVKPRKCEDWFADPLDPALKKIESWNFYRRDPRNPGPSDPNSYLDAGADLGFCISGSSLQPGSTGKPTYQYCLPIHVLTPMFKTPYVLVPASNGNSAVAVFGVVDPDFRSYLPKQNAGWDVLDPTDSTKTKVLKNSQEIKKSKGNWLPHRIEIATLPPQDALQQALDAFLLDQRPSPFGGITVLMAEMAYGAADELARNLKAPDGLKLNPRATATQPDTHSEPAFDIVIAKSEFAHQTRNQDVTVPAWPTNTRYRFLAVPPPAWTEDDKLQLPLGLVTVTRGKPYVTAKYSLYTDYDHCAPHVDPTDPTHVPPIPEECTAASTSAWDELQRQLIFGASSDFYASCYKAIGMSKPDDCSGTKLSACLMKFATCAMLQDSKTFDTEGSDIAFLQPRDIWVPQKGDAWQINLANPTKSVQELLDRIFWKDDLLAHADLSGSQLKALIKDSAKIEKDEGNPLSILRDTTGRGLKYAGFLKGTEPKPGGTDPSYYSHLDELSDSSLYRVAASSYIANGETGYTEFASPTEVELFSVRTDKVQQKNATAGPKNNVGVRISVLVCEALRDGALAQYKSNYQCGDPSAQHITVDEKAYAISDTETQNIAGLTMHDDREQDSPREYLEAQVQEFLHQRSPFKDVSKTLQDPNRLIQNYPYLDVNLENLSITGSLNTALASRAETKNFSGVLQTDIPQASKSEFAIATKLRLLNRRGRWDFGGAIDEQFDKSVQGSLTKPSSPNWSQNSLTIGPVVQFSIGKPRIAPRHLLVFHFDYTRQIANTTLSLSGAPGSASIPPLPQNPSQGYQPKGGYRFESGDSYFETGGIYTKNYNVLSEVAGLPGGAVCDLAEKISLSSCVGNILFPSGSSTPVLHYKTFGQAGWYWDGKLNIDVFKSRWSYVLSSQGKYYFVPSDDVSALSRLDATLSNSLKFPLFGNFSLVPKAEWRFFENQVTRDFLKRINTSVSLTYNFHKDSRVRLGHAMAYKSSSGSAP